MAAYKFSYPLKLLSICFELSYLHLCIYVKQISSIEITIVYMFRRGRTSKR